MFLLVYTMFAVVICLTSGLCVPAFVMHVGVRKKVRTSNFGTFGDNHCAGLSKPECAHVVAIVLPDFVCEWGY